MLRFIHYKDKRRAVKASQTRFKPIITWLLQNRLFLLISVQNELPTIRQMNTFSFTSKFYQNIWHCNWIPANQQPLTFARSKNATVQLTILVLGIHTVFLVQFEINLQKWAFGKTHKWKSIANWTRKIVLLLIKTHEKFA